MANDDLEAYLAGLSARPVEPEGHVPLTLDRNHLHSAFNDWLRGLRFVPGKLKKTAMLEDDAEPMYVPVWLVSGTAAATYFGERGTDYKEKEETTDAAGNTQTREVTKTRWEYVSGQVQHHFENEVVCGWSGVPDGHAHVLKPREGALQPHSADVTGSHKVQPCEVSARAAFGKIRDVLAAEVRRLAARDIGGDKQKIERLDVRHVGVTLRHVLMPVYRGRYRFRNKDYCVTVNAATGEAAGDYPISAAKVLFAILLGLAVVAAIVIGLIVAFKK
ncbi:MAG: hypothetical protein HYS12_28885 [Planctomycetes bacterium]|nr:hypothetical protein [Planctomycetota bacterium]